MKMFLLIAAILVALIALILIIGACLPREHSATRAVVLHRPAAEMYASLRDFAAVPQWRPEVHSVEMLDAVDGRIRFREHSNDGAITYEVVEDKPPERLITRIVDEDLGYSGSWTYELSPTAEGTRIQITEKGEVSNVLFRFLSRFVFGHTATMDAYLRALGRKVGEEVNPR